MNKLQNFFFSKETRFAKWDFLVFMFLTLASLWQRQTTVFYLIYFFWWTELITISIDKLFYRKNPNAKLFEIGKHSFFASVLLLAIYFIFIVLIFGYFAVANQSAELLVNFQVLRFENWFFNANLLFVIIERIFQHKSHQKMYVGFGGFTMNMIVIHLSIIFGAIVLFFVVKAFPNTFTMDNSWSILLIALPFLLLKLVANYFSNRLVKLG